MKQKIQTRGDKYILLIYKFNLLFCSPGDVLHSLQINVLRSEKDSMETKLQQAWEKISSLEAENVDLRTKFGKATGITLTIIVAWIKFLPFS